MKIDQKFHICPAENRDTAAVHSCVNEAYNCYLEILEKPPSPLLDDYEKVIDERQVFVCKINNKVIGVLVLMMHEKGFMIDNIAVQPEYQGKGIGRKLIEKAESEAVRQGHSQIHLFTNQRMFENIRLYTHLGYVEKERFIINDRHGLYMCKSII